jgi:adenosylcobyric acid synthase
LAQPFATLQQDRADGAVSADGRIMGTYIHGLLASSAVRAHILGQAHDGRQQDDHSFKVDGMLDEIAGVLARSLDISALAHLAGITATMKEPT